MASVLRPASVRELVDALHAARDAKQRLGEGGVELDRGALSQIGAIDDQSMTIEAQAGARLSSIETVLSASQLTLGPLPPSAWSMTLAEYLEGPYAGLRAVSGGRLEPLCGRLEGVFADGRHFTSSPAPRSAAGPDLRALFLGASGRLGLVTSAALRAFAAPENSTSVVAAFTTPREAVAAIASCLGHGVVFSRVQLRCVSKPPTSGRERVIAWLEWAGSRTNVERDRDVVHRAMSDLDSGRSSAAVVEGPVRETTWGHIELHLGQARVLDLHRVSLTSVVAIGGELEGLRLDAPASKWSMPCSEALAASVDPVQLLGGAP